MKRLEEKTERLEERLRMLQLMMKQAMLAFERPGSGHSALIARGRRAEDQDVSEDGSWRRDIDYSDRSDCESLYSEGDEFLPEDDPETPVEWSLETIKTLYSQLT